MEALIDKLKEMGLNTYESKVYLALLKNNPATGYEVSKESGVPQARAYDTLKALESRGIVVATAGKPVTYLPISANEMLDRWESGFKSSVDYLRDALPQMSNETIEPILNLRGKDAVIKHVEEMIDQAQHNIFLEIWQQDAVVFEPKLRQAAERGVSVKVVGYRGVHFDFCDVYEHAISKELAKAKGGRRLMLTVDDALGMVGNLPAGETIPRAVYTRNDSIIFVIREFIVHDIYLLDVEEQLGSEMEKLYGKNLKKLRDKLFESGNMTIVDQHH